MIKKSKQEPDSVVYQALKLAIYCKKNQKQLKINQNSDILTQKSKILKQHKMNIYVYNLCSMKLRNKAHTHIEWDIAFQHVLTEETSIHAFKADYL